MNTERKKRKKNMPLSKMTFHCSKEMEEKIKENASKNNMSISKYINNMLEDEDIRYQNKIKYINATKNILKCRWEDINKLIEQSSCTDNEKNILKESIREIQNIIKETI